jgi:hypothetical protein
MKVYLNEMYILCYVQLLCKVKRFCGKKTNTLERYESKLNSSESVGVDTSIRFHRNYISFYKVNIQMDGWLGLRPAIR